MPTPRTMQRIWEIPGAVPFLVLLATGCSRMTAVPVKADHDPTYSFAHLRTYAWAPQRPLKAPVDASNSFLQSRLDSIPALIERELGARGFQPAGPQAPDFLVAYHVTTRRGRIDTFEDFGRYRASGGSGDFGSAYVMGYEEAVLTIDVIDARTRRLVWQASARAPIDEQLSQAQRFTRLQEAVRKMLRKFPPSSGA